MADTATIEGHSLRMAAASFGFIDGLVAYSDAAAFLLAGKHNNRIATQGLNLPQYLLAHAVTHRRAKNDG